MSFVKYEPKGNIAYLIIDREKALNALNSQVLADLDAALDAVDLSEIRCLIVRGAGEKSFVAGADIAQMKELSKEEAEAFGKQGNDVMRKLEAFPIPTIAAVGGYALGGGCELAMSCDFRICSDTAVFGQPETGLGITPGFGGTQRLARLVGPGPPEGDVLFFADQLFPVNARADLNFGLAFIGHRQHCLRDGGKVPGAIPLYCDLQHAFRPPDG